MLKLVDRYIGRAACLGIIWVWFPMTFLFIIIGLLGELRDTQADYETMDAFHFVTLTIPSMAYQIFPVSALIGALVGIGSLAAANELVAFRTAGISRLRLAFAALAGTFLLTIPVMILGEWVAPAAEQEARAFKLNELGQAIIGGTQGMWIRDGADFVNVQRPVLTADRGQESVDFKKVIIYSFFRESDLQSITRAESASHDGTSWTLNGVKTVSFTEAGASQTQTDQQNWPTDIMPELLDSAVTRPKFLSIRSLWEYLGYLGENGLDDSVYLAAFWGKVLFPFTVLALVFAGMPFVFGQARTHNIGVQLFFGMTLGGLFVIVSRTLQKFGAVYEVPSVITISVPILVLIILSVLVLRRSV